MAECVFQRGHNVYEMNGNRFLGGQIVTTDKMKLCWSDQTLKETRSNNVKLQGVLVTIQWYQFTRQPDTLGSVQVLHQLVWGGGSELKC